MKPSEVTAEVQSMKLDQRQLAATAAQLAAVSAANARGTRDVISLLIKRVDLLTSTVIQQGKVIKLLLKEVEELKAK